MSYTLKHEKEIKKIGNFFTVSIEMIKDRKIRKLERQAIKAKIKADKLAHEIKTRQALEDSLLDIARYQEELRKLKNS